MLNVFRKLLAPHAAWNPDLENNKNLKLRAGRRDRPCGKFATPVRAYGIFTSLEKGGSRLLKTQVFFLESPR